MNSATLTTTQYWEDQDERMMPFFNFWAMLVCYQIDHARTDNQMADELMIDRKTYVEWRSSITVDGVLRSAVRRIRKSKGARNGQLRKLVRTLITRIRALRELRETIPEVRKDSNLPRKETLEKAVNAAIPKVIAHWVGQMRTGSPMGVANHSATLGGSLVASNGFIDTRWAGLSTQQAAAQVAESLINAYSREQTEGDSQRQRSALILELQKFAEFNMRLAALRALTIFPESKGVGSHDLEDFETHEAKILECRLNIIRGVKAYGRQLAEEALAADRKSEAQSIDGSPAIPLEISDERAKRFEASVLEIMDSLQSSLQAR